MNATQLLDLLVAMVAVAITIAVFPTNLLAALCLGQFAILTVAEYESERVRELAADHRRAFSGLKLALLVVALVDLAV